MKILLLSPILPVPTTGTGTREFNLLKRLADRVEFLVVALAQVGEGIPLDVIRPYCREFIAVPFAPNPTPKSGAELWKLRADIWSRALFNSTPRYASTYPLHVLERPIRELRIRHPDIDIVHAVGLYAAPAAARLANLTTVLTEIDVESDKQRQLVLHDARRALRHRLLAEIELRKLARFERQQLNRVSVCIAMSQPDRELLQRVAPGLRTVVVPNGADTSHFAPPDDNTRAQMRVLFFGHLGYAPNIDAIRFFCNSIWPTILKARPEAEFVIMGPSAGPEVRSLPEQHDHVRFLGFVSDIRPHLWESTICVVPLRMGGGTRLKILESLAAECPVVTTTVGAVGLDLVPGEDISVADTADAFARQVLSLLNDAEARSALARQGRRTVQQRYDWDPIADLQYAAYESALTGRRGA